jgi:pimeloyl-ACP methyl ester carboxylesterase
MVSYTSMPMIDVNGVGIYAEITGTSAVPLVMVHGSWDSHHAWDLVAPRLAERFRVLTYDRRGHGRSERPAGQGSVHEDVADLAALIDHLRLGPAWVVGSSFGASISLRLAATRPDVVRGVTGHEPPLFGLLGEDPALRPLLEGVRRGVAAVAERIAAGDHAGAAEQFVDTVALGAGSWAQTPPEIQAQLIENAPTFLDETTDPDALVLDVGFLRGFEKPILLTQGDQSPPAFAPVVTKLVQAGRRVAVRTLRGAGHVPHLTDPDAYVATVLELVQTHTS